MAKNYSEFKEECRQVNYDLKRYGEREVVKRYCEEHNCSVPEARRYVNERKR